jgi:hypothetical protein
LPVFNPNSTALYLEITVIVSQIVVGIGEAVQPALTWGLQARFLADGAPLAPDHLANAAARLDSVVISYVLATVGKK